MVDVGAERWSIISFGAAFFSSVEFRVGVNVFYARRTEQFLCSLPLPLSFLHGFHKSE